MIFVILFLIVMDGTVSLAGIVGFTCIFAAAIEAGLSAFLNMVQAGNTGVACRLCKTPHPNLN